MDFSQRLKELRTGKGISKVTMAKELDIPYTTYNNYENGREPKYEILRKIARILNVTLGELLDEDFHVYLDDMKNEIHDNWDEKFYERVSNWQVLELNLKKIGYSLKSIENEGYLWLENDKGTIEVTEDEIDDLINEVDTYLLFRIELLKKKKDYYK